MVERPFVAGGPLGWELSPGVIAGALSRLGSAGRAEVTEVLRAALWQRWTASYRLRRAAQDR